MLEAKESVKLAINPVPYDDLVAIVRQCVNEIGITPESFSGVFQSDNSDVDGVKQAAVMALVYRALGLAIEKRFIEPAEGSYKELKALYKVHVLRERGEGGWKATKHNNVLIKQIAILDISLNRQEDWIGMWAKLLVNSGFGEFPLATVTSTLVMDALGILKEQA